MHEKIIGWICYQVVMRWTGDLPELKWFMWVLSWAGHYAEYPCENCIGMKEYGCYCKSNNAIQPGGPAALPPNNRKQNK